MFVAPLSVSVHGQGGEGGGAGREGGGGRGGGGGREGSGGSWSRELESPLSRQPDDQQYTRQHSSSSHTLSEHQWPSSESAAVLEAGHWLVPLESP